MEYRLWFCYVEKKKIKTSKHTNRMEISIQGLKHPSQWRDRTIWFSFSKNEFKKRKMKKKYFHSTLHNYNATHTHTNGHKHTLKCRNTSVFEIIITLKSMWLNSFVNFFIFLIFRRCLQFRMDEKKNQLCIFWNPEIVLRQPCLFFSSHFQTATMMRSYSHLQCIMTTVNAVSFHYECMHG